MSRLHIAALIVTHAFAYSLGYTVGFWNACAPKGEKIPLICRLGFHKGPIWEALGARFCLSCTRDTK